MNDEFEGWEEYLETLASTTPSVAVIGATDYLSTRGYERLAAHRSEGRLEGVELVFPNIEFRVSPETKRSKGVNVHLLVSPDDPEHVTRIQESLARLTIEIKDDRFACTRDQLIRLGRTHDPSLGDDEQAYSEGVNQFKVPFEVFRQWRREEPWLTANSLVAVDASSDDGASGLQHDSGFAAVRGDIYRYADIILSGNPQERAFWLGEGACSEAELRDKYGGSKPCLHGCDAHRVTNLFRPAEYRRCWIKADPTFEGLRQTLCEPGDRVFIGEAPPERPNPDQVVASLRIDHANGWFLDDAVPLNPGLVTIIGEKGSGKTALADLIACAAGVPAEEDSFLERAREHLHGVTPTITWGSGRTSTQSFPDSDALEPQIRYLPQRFVDRLCAGSSIDDELREEIESVVFAHLDSADALEASSFDELREIRTRALRERRSAIRGDISQLNSSISKIDAERRGAPRKRKLIAELSEEVKRIKNQYPKIDNKEAEGFIKQLDVLEQSQQRSETELGRLGKHLQRVLDLRRRVDSQRRDLETFWTKLRRDLIDVGISETDVDVFEPRFAGDTKTPFDTLEREIRDKQKALKGPEQVAPGQTLPSDTLVGIAAQKKAIEAKLKVDTQKQARLKKLRADASQAEKKRTQLGIELRELNEKLVPKRKQLAESRFSAYREYFELLAEEKRILENLYAPLGAYLSKRESHEQRLELYIRTTVDVELWAARGEELFDLRRGGPLSQKGGILKEAQSNVLDAWRAHDGERVEAGIHHFIKLMTEEGELTEALCAGVELEHVADWLFSVDHIDLDYGLRYDGTELEKLSPGTKGIVLLILYLAIDQQDQRPLIVDQPDENLDNQSIYGILREYFRQARERRQVILVTHNPNLVVNTDADQVIVAKCERGDDRLPRIS